MNVLILALAQFHYYPTSTDRTTSKCSYRLYRARGPEDRVTIGITVGKSFHLPRSLCSYL